MVEGKLTLVTGGSRGIGKTIAERLAEAGAEVILTARTSEAAEAVAAPLREAGHKAHGVALDVSDEEAVKDGVKALGADYGKISFLINNAGITRDNLLMRMKPGDWEAVIQTNLAGVYRMCRHVAPMMIKQRHGRIINITSVVASSGNPGQVNYCAAKAGVEGLTRSLARELASRNITVNAIAPGFIDTDMTRDLDDDQRATLLEQVPIGRLGSGDDIASAVLYLASPGADYVTGQTLHVNGGMYM